MTGRATAKSAVLNAFEQADPDERVQIAKSASGGSVDRVGFEATVEGSVGVLHKSDTDDYVIWGPASVEVVDKENDRIKAEALEDALPQLMKRQSLSYEHSDQIVGKILDKFETDEPVDVEIGDRVLTRSEFPTDVIKDELDEPALFVAGNVYGDTQKCQEVREAIDKNEINSYSISGEAIVTSMAIENGQPVTDISKLDLSAVTLCKEGMNPGAKFGVVKKRDGASEPSTTPTLSPSRAEAVLKSQTMKHNGNEGESPLTKSGMEAILDKHLPEGELATKEDVESIARTTAEEVVKENATNTDSPTEGAADRPDGEDSSPTETDPEYEGDSPDETVSDSDKVEEKADDHPAGCRCDDCQSDDTGEGMTMDELKSALPDDQFKAIKPTLKEAMDVPDEEPEPEPEPAPDEMGGPDEDEGSLDVVEPDEDEDDEEELLEMGAEKAKAVGIDPDNLTQAQQSRLAKADLNKVDGAGAVAGEAGGSALDDGEVEKDSTTGTTMAGSNFFDGDGGVKL